MKYFLFLIASLAMNLVAAVANLFLPLFAKDGWLPKWLWWFQTPDNPLDGDEGFKTKHAPFKGDGVKGVKRYINQVTWLYRNAIYGFEWTVLAFEAQPGAKVFVSGDADVTDNSPMHPGAYFKTITNPNGKSAWQFYAVLPKSPTKYMEINLGWKLWSAPGKCQFVFSPSFWKTIR